MYLLADKRKATHNSTYKKLAVQCLNKHLCFLSSSFLADSFVYKSKIDELRPNFCAFGAIAANVDLRTV
jgi:hypothetical protein